jgi:pectinesterase
VHASGPTTLTKRRSLLAGAVAGTASLFLGSGSRALSRVTLDAVVSKNGRPGTLRTLADALVLARRSNRPFTILLGRGIFDEKLHIDCPNLTLVGVGPETIVSHGASAGQPGPNGKPWGTGGSATLTVEAPGFTLSNLTIANSFDFLAAPPSGPTGGRQAVALLLAGGADRSIIRNCRILGYQDTLYVREGQALFDSCEITGGTDFIFGGATALFRRCKIVSRFVPGAPIQGYVTAPSTASDQEIGLVFDHCRLVREAGVPDRSVFLGRPWRAGGNMELTSFAAFVDCWMDAHIRPEGWTAMHYGARGGVEGWLTPQQARLYESGSRGPGAGRASSIRRELPPGLRDVADPGRIFPGWSPAVLPGAKRSAS